MKTRVLVASRSSASSGDRRSTGDRVRESRVDRDVGAFHVRIGQQLDAGPVDERVVVGPGERQRAIGQLARERRLHVAEAGQVVRVQPHDEPVRHERPVGRGEPLGLHRALDPPLQLDGLQAGPEQASGWSLE